MQIIRPVDIKRTKCTVVYLQFDILGRGLKVQQEVTIMNRTVNCVTLWFLYVCRPEETSEKRHLWLWRKAVMLLDWGSSTLDITAAGIVGISYCCYGFGYCTVLMLAVLTDGRWKLAAIYCNTVGCHRCGMML